MFSTNWREKQPQKARIWNQKLALSVCLRMLFKISITAVGQAVKFDWIDLFPEVFPSKENESRSSQATLMVVSEMNKSSTFVVRNWHWCLQHKTDAVGQLFDCSPFHLLEERRWWKMLENYDGSQSWGMEWNVYKTVRRQEKKSLLWFWRSIGSRANHPSSPF